LILANLEANIDFSAEDIELVSAKSFVSEIGLIISDITNIVESYSTGKKLKDGLQVSLVGLPNAGKSSFLNALIGQDKAIVTNIPGTTRDVIEASFIVNGIEFNFLDTAGIHITDDPIEKIGINKSLDAIANSDFVFFLYDSSADLNALSHYQDIFKSLQNKSAIFINTKTDLLNNKQSLVLSKDAFTEKFSSDVNWVSFLSSDSVNSNGLNEVQSWLAEQTHLNFNESSSVLTQARHYELLCDCLSKLKKSQLLMSNNESPEFIAFELQASLQCIYEILGKVYDDQVMDKVFNEFCIGK